MTVQVGKGDIRFCPVCHDTMCYYSNVNKFNYTTKNNKKYKISLTQNMKYVIIEM